MKSLSVNGTEIWYLERGNGLPLLLVHGFPLDHTMWAGQIEALATHCRVIVMDLPGFGRSPARSDLATMEQFADDCASLLDALNIREPVVVCGLSMGGYVALQFWRKHAARLAGLILCDTRANADTPEAVAVRQATAARVVRDGVAPLVETMLPKLLAETTRQRQPQVVEGLRAMFEAGNARGVAAAARGMAVRPDMTSALAEIGCPTLVIVGQEDAISPPAEMGAIARAIPGAKFVAIPAAGHMAPLENPRAVNDAIVEFVSNL